jgi:hypothetical protein
MKTYGGVEVQFQKFLTPALDEGGQLHAAAVLKRPSGHWIGGLVGLTAGLDAVARKYILPGIEPQTSRLVTTLTELPCSQR